MVRTGVRAVAAPTGPGSAAAGFSTPALAGRKPVPSSGRRCCSFNPSTPPGRSSLRPRRRAARAHFVRPPADPCPPAPIAVADACPCREGPKNGWSPRTHHPPRREGAHDGSQHHHRHQDHPGREPTAAEVAQLAELLHLDPATLLVDVNVRHDARLDPAFLASIKDHGVLIPIVAVRTADRRDPGPVRAPAHPRRRHRRTRHRAGDRRRGRGHRGRRPDRPARRAVGRERAPHRPHRRRAGRRDRAAGRVRGQRGADRQADQDPPRRGRRRPRRRGLRPREGRDRPVRLPRPAPGRDRRRAVRRRRSGQGFGGGREERAVRPPRPAAARRARRADPPGRARGRASRGRGHRHRHPEPRRRRDLPRPPRRRGRPGAHGRGAPGLPRPRRVRRPRARLPRPRDRAAHRRGRRSTDQRPVRRREKTKTSTSTTTATGTWPSRSTRPTARP